MSTRVEQGLVNNYNEWNWNMCDTHIHELAVVGADLQEGGDGLEEVGAG